MRYLCEGCHGQKKKVEKTDIRLRDFVSESSIPYWGANFHMALGQLHL